MRKLVGHNERSGVVLYAVFVANTSHVASGSVRHRSSVRSFCTVRATLGAAADPSRALTRGNPKIYQKEKYTPEPGISPNKGKSKDKSLEITLLGSPSIY